MKKTNHTPLSKLQRVGRNLETLGYLSLFVFLVGFPLLLLTDYTLPDIERLPEAAPPPPPAQEDSLLRYMTYGEIQTAVETHLGKDFNIRNYTPVEVERRLQKKKFVPGNTQEPLERPPLYTDLTDNEFFSHAYRAKKYLGEEVDITDMTIQDLEQILTEKNYGELNQSVAEMKSRSEQLLASYTDPFTAMLPNGLTLDSTLRDAVLYDHHTFEQKQLGHWIITISGCLIHCLSAIFILFIARAWKRDEPFGPSSIKGLRGLGIMYLVHFMAYFMFKQVLFSDFYTFPPYSALRDGGAELLTTSGNLSSGLVFLMLSWVIQHALLLQEEQAFTI